ncbi:MAG TPA: carbohydrate kinase family protein [Candidatus Paceibacterota bacterium]
MFDRNIDFLAIGDITTDAFIRLKEAKVHCVIDTNDCEITMKFGDKVPFEYVKVIKAVGNSANASVAISRLGISGALVAQIGNDQNGKDCLDKLHTEKVDTRYIKTHKDSPTNYHFVLWYEAERTILVNHIQYDYKFPEIKKVPKWIYLSSLASNSAEYHKAISSYLIKNPQVKLAFQPGTFQIKLGIKELKDIYKRTEVFICNFEEAQKILHTDSHNIKTLLSEMHANGPKIVLITDGPKGAYMLDGEHFYYMPIYPDPKPPLERTGCGDAFASTFVAALSMDKSPLEALLWAPVNPMSVVQYVGAQEGLLDMKHIEWLLENAPEEYKPREI